MTVQLLGPTLAADPNGQPRAILHVSVSELGIQTISPSALFVADTMEVKGEEGILSLSLSVDNELRDYWSDLRGFPSNASDSGFRSLYLSAMTITTVGYGDIVPVTDAARVWVAVEAIYGIVFAGLFVGSVGYRFSGGRAG